MKCCINGRKQKSNLGGRKKYLTSTYQSDKPFLFFHMLADCISIAAFGNVHFCNF